MIPDSNKQFQKDVQKAKANYSRKRRRIILTIMSLILLGTLYQTYSFIREKKELTVQIASQNQEIEKLDKENKVNDVVIDKLKDPYFISDLVRQEYGLSYEGEIVFNLPDQENFLQSTINSIMDSNAEKSQDDHGRIDDSKLPELKKDDTSTTDKNSTNNKTTTSKNTKTQDDEEDTATSQSSTTKKKTNNQG